MVVALVESCRASHEDSCRRPDAGGWGGSHSRPQRALTGGGRRGSRRGGTGGRDDPPSRRRDVLGRLLGNVHRSRRPSVGGCPQPRLDDRRGRLRPSSASGCVSEAPRLPPASTRPRAPPLRARCLPPRRARPESGSHRRSGCGRRASRLGTPAAARMPASCPAPELSSTQRQTARLDLRAKRALHLAGHPDRLGPVAGLEADRPDERVEPHGCRVHVRLARAGPSMGSRFRRRARRRARRPSRPLPVSRVAASRMRRISVAAATSASRRPSIGTVPAWPAVPSTRSSPRAIPAIDVTTPSGAPARSSTGPCSTCSSRNTDGSAPPCATSARLPMHPTSSPRKTTTDPTPARSTASIPATTPRAPSNRPPAGTVSRCEPVHTDPVLSSDPWTWPKRLPCAVDLDLQPGLAHPPRGELECLVLTRRAVGPVRAWPASDRVQLFEPLRDPHTSRFRMCTDSSTTRASGTRTVRRRCRRRRSA